MESNGALGAEIWLKGQIGKVLHKNRFNWQRCPFEDVLVAWQPDTWWKKLNLGHIEHYQPVHSPIDNFFVIKYSGSYGLPNLSMEKLKK